MEGWVRRARLASGHFLVSAAICLLFVIMHPQETGPWTPPGGDTPPQPTADCPYCHSPATLHEGGQTRFQGVHRYQCVGLQHVFLVRRCALCIEPAANRGMEWICTKGHSFPARLCPRCGGFCMIPLSNDGWLRCEQGCGEFAVGHCAEPGCPSYAAWPRQTRGPWVCELYSHSHLDVPG